MPPAILETFSGSEMDKYGKEFRCVYINSTVNILKFHRLKFLIKWHMQTVQTQIRQQLLEEQSEQGLHNLQFHFSILRNNKKQSD